MNQLKKLFTKMSLLGLLLFPFLFNGSYVIYACEDDFTIVLLPDTQYYSETYHQTYLDQTTWIKNNVSSKNIKFVIHLGDITNNNYADNDGLDYYHDPSPSEWDVADAAHDILDYYGIPYCATIGNHDLLDDGVIFYRNSTNFNNYFGVNRFNAIESNWDDASYGGGYPSGKNDNSYYFFQSGDLKFLVISLEYAPRKDTLTWAANVIKAHQDHRVIIVTHGYLVTSNHAPIRNDVTTAYNLVGSDGTTLFNEFISRYSNIFMVVAGHHNGDTIRTITGNSGNTIYEVLVDFQGEPNGGNGWLKTMEFSPSEDTIHMTAINIYNISTFQNTSVYTSYVDPYPLEYDPDGLLWLASHNYIKDYDMTTPLVFEENIEPCGFNDRTMNSVGAGQQTQAKVAMTPSGYSVVVWMDDSNYDGKYVIKMKGFTPDGAVNFEETLVSSAAGNHYYPSVAVDSCNNVVVVWQDDTDGNGYYEIKMSGYNINGTSRFSNYTVNTVSNGQQKLPSVAIDSSGKFVVVWQDDADGNGYYEILMRGFYYNGTQYFSQRTVNSISSGQQLDPDVEFLSNGRFVVVWEDDNDNNGYYEILMRGFYASGYQYFSQRTVNSIGDGQQYNPSICRLPCGKFVIAWQDDNDQNNYYEILMRGFYYNGTQYFSQRTVNTISDGQQYYPLIASDADGNFAVTWQDDLDDNGWYQIMIRAFDQNATQILAQTTVNKDYSGQQFIPDVAFGNEGRIVVVWTDDLDGNGYYQILGRGAYDFYFFPYFWY